MQFSRQLEQLPRLKRLDINSDVAEINCTLPASVRTVMLERVYTFDVEWPDSIETVVAHQDIISKSILKKPNIKRVLSPTLQLGNDAF